LSSFSKTIAVSLASKYKKDAGVLLKDRLDTIIDKEAKKLLQAYSKPVQDAVLDAVVGLGDNFAKGIVKPEYAPLSGRGKTGKDIPIWERNRHYGYYAQKLKLTPRYANKFWRFKGDTSKEFNKSSKGFLSSLKSSKPSYAITKKQTIPRGIQVTIRLSSNVPAWASKGMDELIMGSFRSHAIKRTSTVEKGLRTLVYNEEGTKVQIERPFISSFIKARRKLLEAKIARFIK
jgi:hypothetical protein